MTAVATPPVEVEPGWREVLAWVREQRKILAPAAVRVWDAKWRRWLEIYLGRGGTPTDGVSFAYRKTLEQLGPRPGPYPDGRSALASVEQP